MALRMVVCGVGTREVCGDQGGRLRHWSSWPFWLLWPFLVLPCVSPAPSSSRPTLGVALRHGAQDLPCQGRGSPLVVLAALHARPQLAPLYGNGNRAKEQSAISWIVGGSKLGV